MSSELAVIALDDCACVKITFSIKDAINMSACLVEYHNYSTYQHD